MYYSFEVIQHKLSKYQQLTEAVRGKNDVVKGKPIVPTTSCKEMGENVSRQSSVPLAHNQFTIYSNYASSFIFRASLLFPSFSKADTIVLTTSLKNIVAREE